MHALAADDVDEDEQRENERWQRMLAWLVDEHGMAGDEESLRVVGRRARGAQVVDCNRTDYNLLLF